MSTYRAGVRAKLAPLLSGGGLTAMAIGAGCAGVILVVLDFSSPLAGPLALVFLGLAPAAAISGLLDRFDVLARLVIAATASIVINFLVAETMLAAGAWSVRGSVIAVTAITVACAVAQLTPVRALLAQLLGPVRGAAARLAAPARPGTSARGRRMRP